MQEQIKNHTTLFLHVGQLGVIWAVTGQSSVPLKVEKHSEIQRLSRQLGTKMYRFLCSQSWFS